jgi:hypothetical protein
MHVMEVPHRAHVAPENVEQLVHAAAPAELLKEPAEHATHGPPFAPV